ncbi:MAG: ABC transporter permease [Oscillospiraceae bacterium]|jgi:ABC-type dipeptide/oligopeptide/nickel transport system permease component
MNRIKAVLYKILAQLLQFSIVLIGITFLTFSIMFLSPKNPAELWLAGTDGHVGMISEEAIREQEHIMGLDKPFLVQYGSWLVDVVQGDLGISFSSKRPVSEELYRHMGPTVSMTVLSLSVTVLLSVPLGILCAVYKDRLLDNIMRGISFIGISLPSFVLSLIFLWFFCMKLNLMPVISSDGIKGIILPSCVLILQCTSKMTRQVRAIVLEQLDQPYVDGAIIRGVKYRTILFSHVLKNSAAPILTCISIYVGLLLGGSAVIEGIFSVNGLGRLAVSSAARLDQYVLQGFVLWIALVYLLVNLAVDILSSIIDPKVKYGRTDGGRGK